jgi:hypothetical protein
LPGGWVFSVPNGRIDQKILRIKNKLRSRYKPTNQIDLKTNDRPKRKETDLKNERTKKRINRINQTQIRIEKNPT